MTDRSPARSRAPAVLAVASSQTPAARRRGTTASSAARAGAGDAIGYRLELADPAAHLFVVTLRIAKPAPEGQRVALPAWIPGSYMIREFARHIVAIDARSGGRKVALTKLDKHTWQAARCDGPLEIRCEIYAWDLSVRAAHFDATHAFFNGTSVFLRVLGQEHLPCTLELAAPASAAMQAWRVATTLPRAGAPAWGFGRYRARDYDELVDHPVEIGDFTLASFKAAGIAHHVVITGRHDCDTERLCRDLAPVCEAQIRLFEPSSKRAPFGSYIFLVMAVGDGYGGLEHRASTALLCGRDDLPWRGMTGTPEGYRKFLGLCSHEYFHSWNVKRIKPAAFVPYALDAEGYTRLLWIFEGFTSYYDDLMLLRGGAVTQQEWLKLIGDQISGVLRAPGRHRQSVAESSFEAWTKYYRQDEQSPNSIVSYYAKGAMVAMCIDLAIRAGSAGKRSLDDVMRLLWKRFGRDFDTAPRGLDEDAFPGLVAEATGVDLSREIRDWAYGTGELPLAVLLAPFGLDFTTKAAEASPWLGLRTAMRGTDLTVTTVLTDGPGHRAGLSAGDVLMALDGIRLNAGALKTLVGRRKPGQTVSLHVFRRDELHVIDLVLGKAPASEATLALAPKAKAPALALRKRWLGAPLRKAAG